MVDNFYCNYADEVSVVIMQVVFSAVNCAYNCFYCYYASKPFFYSYAGDSLK